MGSYGGDPNCIAKMALDNNPSWSGISPHCNDVASIRAFVFDWSGATSYMYVIAGFHIIVSYRRGEGGGGALGSPPPQN